MTNTSKLWLTECAGVVFAFVMSGFVRMLFTATGFVPFAVISPVNQSVWECLKVIVTPFVIYSAIEYIILKPNKSKYIDAKAAALIVMVIIYGIIYYALRYIMPEYILIADIISAATMFVLGFSISYKLYGKKNKTAARVNLTTAFVFALLITFVVFTFITPKLKIFTDPVTETYGISTYFVNKLIALLQELQ